MSFSQAIIVSECASYGHEIKNKISQELNLSEDDFYLLKNGKLVENNALLTSGNVIQIVLRLCGGKGGFGSMLRAIGAQIEKTTNREACRDLSGRRLRDINEEKRLKNWIASQGDREQEALDRKQKKLERLCYQPKHKFEDSEYEKLRSELPEKVSDAVEEGFKMAAAAAATATGNTNAMLKRKADNKKNLMKNKKKKLWVDADLSCSEESSGSESDDEGKSQRKIGNAVKSIPKMDKCETVTSATC